MRSLDFDLAAFEDLAPYMEPEQAPGGAVDKRAAIPAFGVVLYEMLTGRLLFTGATVSDTLAAMLKTDPDWSLLPAETPAAIPRLLRRRLERDRSGGWPTSPTRGWRLKRRLRAARGSRDLTKFPALWAAMRLVHYIPASFMARGISGFCMNHFQRLPERRFSALSSVMPTSSPRTSGDTQPLVGWNASVKP